MRNFRVVLRETGEKVLNRTEETSPAERATPKHGLWFHSSMDLAQGLDVLEVPLDTLPGDLWPPTK